MGRVVANRLRPDSSKYHRNRDILKQQAQAAGLTHCPGFNIGDRHLPCSMPLDYENKWQSNSAEADHIIPLHMGGSDDLDNLRILCRACNNKRNRTKVPPPPRNQYAKPGEW